MTLLLQPRDWRSVGRRPVPRRPLGLWGSVKVWGRLAYVTSIPVSRNLRHRHTDPRGRRGDGRILHPSTTSTHIWHGCVWPNRQTWRSGFWFLLRTISRDRVRWTKVTRQDNEWRHPDRTQESRGIWTYEVSRFRRSGPPFEGHQESGLSGRLGRSVV